MVALLSSVLPDKMTRRSFKFKGHKVTVWKGHRITDKTFEEFHRYGLYLDEGSHKDMLRERNTPRMICAIRDPRTDKIVSYTLLIDGGEMFPEIGDERNGVMGMVGTYTPPEHRGTGFAALALSLMACEILKFDVVGTWTQKCSVYIQHHVHSKFRQIMRKASGKGLEVYRFNYLYSLQEYADKESKYTAPHYMDLEEEQVAA